jgi:cell wall-associated NlpC family hydrolase
MTVDDILSAARACLKTPFRHQGRRLGVGLDCAGVAAHVAASVGCCVLDQRGYGRLPSRGQLEAALDAQPDLERVSDIAARQPGDLLLMRIKRDPQHLAILAGATIIHAYEAVAECCEHDLSPEWAARIVRVYRFRRLAGGGA